MAARLLNKSKFIFDDAHILKSPCRDCPFVKNLPACSKNCQKLSKLQTLLVDIISCSGDVSEYEEYSLMI